MAGVSPEGFTRKTLQEIRGEIYDDIAPLHGVDRNLSPDWPSPGSLVAQMLDPTAERLALAWEALEGLYHARNPNSAQGVHLDHLLALNDVRRLLAAATAVRVAMRGDEATVVGEGTRVSVTATGVELEITEAATITKENALIGKVRVETVANETEYSVNVDGVPYTFESDADAEEAEILAGLQTAINSGQDDVDATVEDGLLVLKPADLFTPFAFDVGANLEIAEIWTPGEFEVTSTGPVQVLAGTVDNILTPVAGLQEVTNLLDGLLGRNRESDDLARVRRLITLRRHASASVGAIEAELAATPGVVAQRVYENITEVTDADGIPPHSFEAVVEGGEDLDVALAIWRKRAGGIRTFGNVNGGAGIEIEDAQGFTQVVKFSRSVARYIHIEVDLILYGEEVFPDGGEAVVAEALLKFGQALRDGQDVLAGRFRSAAIVAVAGIADAVVHLAVTAAPEDSPSFDILDIPMGIRERAAFDSARIVVAVV